jgi:hypothetical protein
MTLPQILSRLQGVTGSGRSYQARCPAHEDQNPSLSLGQGDDGRILLHCFAGCPPEAVVAALGLRESDLFSDSKTRAKTVKKGAVTPQVERPLPDRSGFKPGAMGQLRRLAAMRPFDLAGLCWAQSRGVLVFGSWYGVDCFGVTDQSGRVLELRRLDGRPFPAVGRLREHKSHSVGARDYPCIALVEGLPDFLEAHAVALFGQASHYCNQDVCCVPVAMLSASPAIAEDALLHFAGKVVRIYAHAERAGLLGADKWQQQLQAAGAKHVDVFDFSPYRKRDGQPVNDLYDWREVDPKHYEDKPELWRILP